ncbi:uncharacterized protein LOC111330646 [Stylophora pistillata]|uniref:Protein vav n=1 Tax=Stylophora pistillata TaxID=50429 RepID=A0A2B4S9L8_STYPI|nr:uncharacterized protein LOC111330646 [Stylophora pistillata]PFX25232.1 Protein vav [Stylophora pistillata]
MDPNDRRIQRSWSGSSSYSQVSSQREASGRNDTRVKVEFLLSQLPSRVKDFNFEVQREFSRSLDDLKENGDDWRIVASRLGFSNIIPQLEHRSQPTIDLLRQCTETTCGQLLEILVDVNRRDVLDDLVKFCNERNTDTIPLQHLGSSPTQESDFGRSTSSGLSWPLQDSGCESISIGGPKAQESEEKEEDFLSDESKKFWLQIPGAYERKSWKEFYQAAKNACPIEMQQGNVQKFLSKLLNIEFATDKIGLDQFLELVALFGPFKPGPEGCLQKMSDLMRYSISVRDGTKESWFAGRMNETESADRLTDQAPGYYLLRISSSRAHQGVFVLAVKTKDNGVVQIQIERDLQNGNLLIADRKFKDLRSVVDALRRDVLLENCKQLIINPCPGLPLNAVFTGYVDAGARQGGRGRGKPRK